jgi:ribonuclease D
MTIIKTTDELNDFCSSLNDAEFIAIDTEFVREKTYWPILCLIQIAGPDGAKAIDPFNSDLNFASFKKLLRNKKIIKIFHDGRQDIEIIYSWLNIIPTPLFDSQVAAMMSGLGDMLSYEKLVKYLMHKKLDKTMQYTDWSRRPLSDEQLHYALDDVIYLREIYVKLVDRLSELGRSNWAKDEFKRLENKQIYVIDAGSRWLRFKPTSKDREYLNILKELSTWRELKAQQDDKPRRHIIKDDVLLEVAQSKPKHMKALQRIRHMKRDRFSDDICQEIVSVVELARAMPEESWPEPLVGVILPKAYKPLADLLQMLLDQKSIEHGISVRMIANSNDIRQFLIGDKRKVGFLRGWRREIFGDDARDLMAGKKCIFVNKGQIIVRDL